MSSLTFREKLGLVLSNIPLTELPKLLLNLFLKTSLPMKLKDGSVVSSVNIPFLKGLRHKGRVVDEENQIFEWNISGRKFYGTNDQMAGFFYEYVDGKTENMYSGPDVKGKIVVDIGAHIGDSALFFLERGASKVVAYEPVPINVMVARKNLREFKDAVELIQKAICQGRRAMISSNVPMGSMGFGSSSGEHSIEVECESIPAIIERWKPEILKMDCEGCEAQLLSIDKGLLRTVPYWVVEVHSKSIRNAILQKFTSAGFLLIKEISLTPEVSLLHLSLNLKEPSAKRQGK